jgi:hypothetical protein
MCVHACGCAHVYIYEGQSENSWNSLTLTVWCTMSLYRLHSMSCASFVEVVRCSSEEAARQVVGTVVSVSRQRTEPHSACCPAIPHREKHSCHHPASVLSRSCSEWLLAVPYSENRVWPSHSIWCRPFRNHGWQTSDRMWWPNSGIFWKKPSTSASNNGRIDGAHVCVHACARAHITIPGTFWVPIVYDKLF